jgi:hypothetical protein
MPIVDPGGGFVMRRLFLASLALALLLPRFSAADEPADGRAILEEAIKAHGGEAALGKFVAAHARMKATTPASDKTIGTAEIYTQGFDKARTTVWNEASRPRVIEVVNGKDGWIKQGDGEARAMTETQLATWHERIYAKKVGQLVILKGPEFKLSPLDEIPVRGRPAVGILVRHEKHEAVKLYFDKESHLQVMTMRRTMNPDLGREVVEEFVLSDYRTVQGTKRSFKSTGYRDGAITLNYQVTLLENSEKPFDDKLFAKP